MKIFKTIIKTVKNMDESSLSDHVVSKCCFCQKKSKFDPIWFKKLHRLSGYKEFFCEFCTRNNFNTRANKDVLILTFKNIFSYYYTNQHIKLEEMWVSEIKDIIENHKKAGLSNPVFYYDDDSMNWFVDFSRVGETKRKIVIEDVYKTVILIIESLKIRKSLDEVDEEDFKNKYLEAIKLFGEKRYRPKNKKILSPKVGDGTAEIIFLKNQ